MAELAAFGLACNIAQFIDFGIKFFFKVKELYDSVDGASEQRLELEKETSDLELITQELKQGELQATKGDIKLRELSSGCNRLAKELLEILKKLKVQKGRSRKWGSFIKALEGMMMDRTIKNIEERLHKHREALGTHMLYLLGNKSSSILRTLQDLRDENRRLNAYTVEALDGVEKSLVREIKKALLQKSDGSKSEMFQLKKLINDLTEESGHVTKQQAVLGSLWFQDLEKRPAAVKDAHSETFRWIFDSKETNFSNWLQFEEGIYWIEGKAGSGKSTLMKYLQRHPATKRHLTIWAEEKKCRLIISSHFFWNAGTPMQQSQEGLLQTLLYQIFRQCPEMMKQSCGDRWQRGDCEPAPWSRDELLEVFSRLSQTNIASAKFCFFVDGLDEYSGRTIEGDTQEVTHEQHAHEELVDLLNILSQNNSFKFCVSSRPWNVFQGAYGESVQRLKLQDHTTNDIRKVVRIDLEDSIKFSKLRCPEADRSKIVEEIIGRACGVFLWVSLVIKTLLRGLTAGDNLAKLQERLRLFPVDLKRFFSQMIINIEPIYRGETILFFDAAMKARRALPVLAFEFLYEENQNKDYAIHAPIKPQTDPEMEDTREHVKIVLDARCRDLLEIVQNPKEGVKEAQYRVEFLHRTVRDFLLKQNPFDQCRKSGNQGAGADVQVSLCKIIVGLCKALPITADCSPGVKTLLFDYTDDILYHARIIELHGREDGHNGRRSTEIKLLNELNRTNSVHFRNSNLQPTERHWSSVISTTPSVIFSIARGKRDEHKTFLAMAVEAKLEDYVRDNLDTTHWQVDTKLGRPLLDYALRPGLGASELAPSKRLRRDLPDSPQSPDYAMVELLLQQGAKPNQPSPWSNNETVWRSFLERCQDRESIMGESSDDQRRDLYRIIDLLLSHGADPNMEISRKGIMVGVEDVLEACLNEKDFEDLKESLLRLRKRQFWGLGKWIGWR